MPRRASGSPRHGAGATDAAAPGMVEAILDGRQPEGVTLPALLEGVPVEWGEQIEGGTFNSHPKSASTL